MTPEAGEKPILSGRVSAFQRVKWPYLRGYAERAQYRL